MLNIWSYVVQAGTIGYLLVAVSILSVGVIIERLWFWIRQSAFPSLQEQSTIIKAFEINDTEQIKLLSKNLKNSPESRSLSYMSEQIHCKNDKPLDIVMSREVRATRKWLAILDLNSGIAPMLGILGTVTGVIQSFKGMSGNTPDTGAMISGISVSMLTTAIGLVVALISLIPYNYFEAKAHKRQLCLSEFIQECWLARSIENQQIKESKTQVVIKNIDVQPINKTTQIIEKKKMD